MTGAAQCTIVEAANGFASVFRACGARGPAVARLAALLGAVVVSQRPNLPKVVLVEEDRGPLG